MGCGSIVLADRHPSMLVGIRSLLTTEADAVLMAVDEVSLLAAVRKVCRGGRYLSMSCIDR